MNTLPSPSLAVASGAAADSLSHLDVERVARSGKVSDAERLEEMTQRFEAMMVKQMLKTMHQPLFEGGAMSSGLGEGFYGDLAMQHLSDAISRADQLGVARSLQEQLGGLLESPENAADADGAKRQDGRGKAAMGTDLGTAKAG